MMSRLKDHCPLAFGGACLFSTVLGLMPFLSFLVILSWTGSAGADESDISASGKGGRRFIRNESAVGNVSIEGPWIPLRTEFAFDDSKVIKLSVEGVSYREPGWFTSTQMFPWRNIRSITLWQYSLFGADTVVLESSNGKTLLSVSLPNSKSNVAVFGNLADEVNRGYGDIELGRKTSYRAEWIIGIVVVVAGIIRLLKGASS